MSLLDDLNPVQQKAVLETEGPLLVFAGAGSGKTRVLTYRIAYLVQEKRVSPWNILAVTFTNKAADEMRERVEKLLGGSTRGAWISTFHSACVRILRRHIDLLGFQKNFVIYDEQDQSRHLKAIIKELGIDSKTFHPRKVQTAIDHLKNRGVSAEQYAPSEFNIFQKKLALIYRLYQEDLRRYNALDFGDLLHFVTVLLRRFPDVLKSYQEFFRYVMVDEFQDTNLIQYDLIKQMVSLHRNICVVGDDDQSIYRWRGAEVGNILNFARDFPECKVITLEQNYRSTQNILQAANAMVSRNRFRKKKVLWTENPNGEPLTLYAAADEGEEAHFVVKKVLENSRPSSFSAGILDPSGRPFQDMAVFYRINAQSRAIEDELVKNRIPYTIVGGMKFYERKEIKDVLAYLKLISNPSDSLSLKRVINVPPRGIGEKTLEKIESLSREKRFSFYEGLQHAIQHKWFTPAAHAKIEEFIQVMEEVRKDKDVFSPSQLAMAMLAKTGYLQRLKEERTDEAISRVENIEELVNVLTIYERGGEEVSLESFLDKVSLLSDVDLYEDRLNRVSLMTLHCAKGLEFPIVFIVGIEEGVLPHYRRGEEIHDLEEERRLFYVGMTRAKEQLFLSRAERRSTFGVGRVNPASRFLEEVPDGLIQHEFREEDSSPLLSGDPEWSEPVWQEERAIDFQDQETSLPGEKRIILTPEGFMPLRIGMRVKHGKFGEGRVRSVEGMDENQKVTIAFPTVGSKRLKVRYANLEILE
jgi:DNA helicase-2/ATP-dependent DNA helicase PcrA